MPVSDFIKIRNVCHRECAMFPSALAAVSRAFSSKHVFVVPSNSVCGWWRIEGGVQTFSVSSATWFFQFEPKCNQSEDASEGAARGRPGDNPGGGARFLNNNGLIP